MTERRIVTVDGNEATASVAFRASEIIAIYPITPSTPMGELSDEWSAKGRLNIWGSAPRVTEMQAEGGAAGAVHGSLQAGALTTTFTASQGLLLMLPNLYKIAGELTSYAMHVSARTVATHALSIFGDHSDVMACRQSGFGLMASGPVQEAHDLACVATAATLRSRVPFLHFFDGFRISHEIAKIEELSDDDLRAMIDDDLVAAHRQRALTPDRPVIRGTAQNPDHFFQSREAVNPYYEACPGIVQEVMDQFGELTGREYNLFDYYGHPEAERVIVIMCSGAETAHATVNHLVEQGEKVGVVKVRLYRPFSVEHFVGCLPSTVKSIAAMDRTKEAGGIGEPLYLDVVSALREATVAGTSHLAQEPVVTGGRYGLSSKEFTPAMVKAVFDNLASDSPKTHFTVGINDDVAHTSLDYDPDFDIESDDVVRGVFFGLGADGTVGANKNSIKIIGEETDNWAQGYFVYDSKKSGAITISHLRFGPENIRSTYLIKKASFVACHQFQFLDRYDVLDYAQDEAVFLLNAPFPQDEVWDKLPVEVQEQIIAKNLDFYVIDGYEVAKEVGMGRRINTIMQTCFFAISGVLPRDEAIAQIKKAIEKTYGKRGEEVVRRNFEAVDQTLAHLHKIEVPKTATSKIRMSPIVPDEAPELVRKVTGPILAGKGDQLPVSLFPADGTWPTGTTQWEKRNVALEVPIWDPDICIQCNKCAMVCPHAAIRAKIYDSDVLAGAPDTFQSVDFRSKELKDLKYTIQVAPEDCTGCTLCVEVCPAKNKQNPSLKAINMEPQLPLRERERENYSFFLDIPEFDRKKLKIDAKNSQFLQPLFEYSGACAGCGETPYLRLISQLYGDRLLIANATGCSSIYGGNLPTTPYAQDREGRGPAWSNSLFEDNAEFGLGMRLAVDKHVEQAQALAKELLAGDHESLLSGLLAPDHYSEAGIADQRERVAELHKVLAGNDSPAARRLEALADYLVRKSIWIVGGDGWAYDIGYGGLDHVLSLERDVNVLVLDTEVYSNTGGQQSKATPIGAAAKFASAGKAIPKKDLGMMAMAYGNIYIAKIALGANERQTVKALQEADSYPGASMIIAYSPCIAHGYDLALGLNQQKLAVDSGYWPLYRFDPRRIAEGESPLMLDSKEPKIGVDQFTKNETRFRMVERQDPERFKKLLKAEQAEVTSRFGIYEQMAQLSYTRGQDH
jgi:pyruvate-ferredoxin/flavodoxin oxidoreductase